MIFNSFVTKDDVDSTTVGTTGAISLRKSYAQTGSIFTRGSSGGYSNNSLLLTHLGVCDNVSEQVLIEASSSSAASRQTQTQTTRVIQKELVGDSLLRILSDGELHMQHGIISAVESGDTDLFFTILKARTGANDNSSSEWTRLIAKIRGLGGYTLLHYSCARSLDLMTGHLLTLQVDPNARNDNGESALHLAAYSGSLLITDQLLDSGADVNAVNNDGESALHYASRKGMPAVVRLLLQRGADRAIEDAYGDTALALAEGPSAAQVRTCFQTTSEIVVGSRSIGSLSYKLLLDAFFFLSPLDVCRAATVCGRFHRVSEAQELWASFGIKRWQLALQKSLGFKLGPSPLLLSFRPTRPSIRSRSRAKPTPGGGKE